MTIDDQTVRAMTGESGAPPASRRNFLAGAGAVAAGATAAALLGGPLAGTADAAVPGCPPDKKFAPIPKRALGPPVNADGFFVGQIKGDLFWVTDSVYIAMFLTTQDGVVLVDAPPTIGHNLLRAIGQVIRANGRPSKVTHLVYSHSHADHTGASVLFGRDVVRIGHRECRTLLLRDNDPNRPPPEVTFEDHFTLTVGGETLLLDFHGPNHTPDNIFIRAPAQDTLMLVDVIFPRWAPFKNLASPRTSPTGSRPSTSR
jgi:glyoxylase-like metal-dependent hydrolase (beta-lactamase superfamily II)